MLRQILHPPVFLVFIAIFIQIFLNRIKGMVIGSIVGSTCCSPFSTCCHYRRWTAAEAYIKFDVDWTI